jgi:alpha-beta hydrolase superfamily lysophospholipase
MKTATRETQVEITLDGVVHLGDLSLPEKARGLVLFAHGSGSSRLSPRNRYVAAVLQQRRVATLLFDLLTPREDEVYATRFDIELLTRRLMAAARWVQPEPAIRSLPLGFFGASTGAAAALRAAARLGEPVRAVVSRGGRPDLAMDELPQVTAPTLLIVGGYDDVVIELNRAAYANLSCEKQLMIVPGATHLFEEPGTLEQAAKSAAEWFEQHLTVAVATS